MVQTFALILGIIYTAAGLLGFIPGLLAPPEAPVNMVIDAWYGRLLNLFPVNALHSLIHIVLGIWGLGSARNPLSSITYARGLAIIFGILAVFGLIPGLNTLFGLLPLYGHDIWLHAATAAIAVYFGWGAPARARNLARI
jgi:hypothetical protein